MAPPAWTKNISGIVFDLDGVLLLSRECHRRAFEEVLAGFDIFDFRYDAFAGWRTPEVFRAVFERQGRLIDEATIAECTHRKSARARQLVAEEKPLAPDCVPVLRLLASRYSLALASSGSRESVDSFLSLTELGSTFSAVLTGGDVMHGKPHPEIFERSIHLLHLEPDQCVVIEDAAAGIESARSARAHVIGMGTDFAAELTAVGAEFVVGSLRELAGILDVL